MAHRPDNARIQGPVFQVDPGACIGCVVCLKVCPTKAIRVRGGLARILPESCVDCGSCYRACPHHAIQPRPLILRPLDQCPHPVALASPTLFGQFGYEVSPNQVLLALRRMGFEEVVDLSWQCDVTSQATEEYLRSHPDLGPIISPTCPVVVNLVSRRFPSLLPNLLPLLPPRLTVARWVKTRMAKRLACPPEDVGLYYISPCAARMAAPQEPLFVKNYYLDGMLSIRDVYGKLLAAIKELGEDDRLQKCSSPGLAWAASGGQARTIQAGHTLAVAGYDEAVTILEMLEAGRLPELSFVEILVCPDGCLGGPLTVENRFRAKSVVGHLIRNQAPGCLLKSGVIRDLLEEGYFAWEAPPRPRPLKPLADTRAQAIAKVQAINELAAELPHSECGLCGSPDCQTFAADVILGLAKRSDCRVLAMREVLPTQIVEGIIMTVGQLVKNLGLEVAAGAQSLEREVEGVYISDMLSAVMAAAPAGSLWLTIQTHQNVAAVAALRDLAAVCLLDGRRPQEDTLAKAEQEGVPILLCAQDAYTLAGRLHRLGVGVGGN